MWKKKNIPLLLVGLQTGTTTLESNLAVPNWKLEIVLPEDPSTPLLCIYPKDYPPYHNGTCSKYVHSSLICNSQKLETTQMSLNWRMDIENVIHLTMEYYSAIKNEDIMNFASKWINLENFIFSWENQVEWTIKEKTPRKRNLKTNFSFVQPRKFYAN